MNTKTPVSRNTGIKNLMHSIRRLTTWAAIGLVLTGIIVWGSESEAATRYAKPAATGAGDCNSWENACTLQIALTDAVSGDEIWVMAGTHKPGTSRESTFQLKSDVAVYGGFDGAETARDQRDPAANVVILSGDLNGDDGPDWANNGENSYHVIMGATATLDGVTISGGNANGTDPYDRGGGMYNINSVHPTLTHVTFSGNFANWQGGGMYNLHSYPNLTRVVFSGNAATEGGGMYSINSSPRLTGVTFSDNSAEDGGGMYNESSSSTLTGVLFSENSATNSGGGMYNLNSGSTLTLTNATFSGNSANLNGGGLYNNSSSPALTNVTFSGNSTDLDGGGVYNLSGSPTLTNVTFSDNSADRGGGMCNAAPGPVTRNSILWDNTARLGVQVYNAYSNAAFIDSVVQGGCPSDSVCTNVITADPLLGAFGDYGGDTQTFPLRPGSPALDAASSSCPATDQRGVTRSTPVCDIGAFESQGFVLAITGGDHQSAPASTAFLQPLALTITANDPLEPVNGGRVIFTGPSSGASTNPAANTATVGADGVASQLVTANGITGAYIVTPTVNATTSVTFSLENTAWLPVLYAIPGGATTNFCDSWTNACELRYALTRSVSGQEIWVKAGTYTPTNGTDRGAAFQLKSGVAVYGGFAGSETVRDARDWTAQVVILSGDLNGDDGPDFANNDENSYHVVTGADGATLDGVTVSGGNADGIYSAQNKGGGMYNSNSSPTLTNVVFSGSAASYGGGMSNESNSSPTLTNVIFSGNSAITGGGMHNSGGSPMLTDVTFSDNAASYGGGGMSNESNSSPTLTNATFSGNATGRNGGGILNWGGSLTLTNITFSGNSAGDEGGGLFTWWSNATLTNLTFNGNAASNGGGLYNGGSPGNAQVRNSIFWGNTGGELVNSDTGTLTIQNSVVQGGYTDGANIVTADPLLGALGNYGGSTATFPLRPGSSAIDAGNASYCTLGHDQRGVGTVGVCDIGAFESQGFALTMTGGDNQTAPITTVFPQPLALTVAANDPAEPVDGGRVTFTGPSSGASTNPVMNLATITGGSVSQSVTANPTTGSYTVTASASGATSVDFDLTNSWTTVYTTTTTLASSLNPSSYSAPVSFTATVTSTGGTPTGSVQFYMDGAPLGLAVPLSDGQAVISTSLIEVGAHLISATYNGAPYYLESASSTLNQVVDCGMTVTVMNAEDSGVGSLRNAIAGACDGGTVTFDDDYSIPLSSALAIDKNLTISGAGHTVGVSGQNVNQVFTVTAGVSVTLQNLTVANGVASILNNGTLTIADSMLNNNVGTITTNSGATLTVLRTAISNNSGGLWSATGPASAGILNYGTLTVTDSAFTGNQFTLRSNGGTAISNTTSGVAVVTGTSFDNNNAGAYALGGGAIANQGQMTINECSFTGNSQPVGLYGGGAIINDAGILTVSDSIFSNNSSGSASSTYPGSGGAISHRAGALTVTGSTFDGNSAYGHGGAIIGLQTLSLTNNTFRGNRAQPASGDGWGGALVAGSSDSSVTFDLTNNTFASNTATVGGNLYFALAGPTVNLYNNILLQGASGGNCSIPSDLTPNASHNLADDATCGSGFNDASSVLLGTFGDYGGDTLTFPLLPGSSAINAGNAVYCTIGHDQRGVSYLGTCDIGAFESRGFTFTNQTGTPQSTVINTTFANPLTLTVTANDVGVPVDGAVVTFTAPTSGAIAVLSSSSVTVGADGLASVTATANGTGGSYAVTASATGATSVNFALRNKVIPVIAQGASVAVTMSEDGSPIAWMTPTISATDADGDPLTWSLSSGPAHGAATVSATGASPTISYTPATNWNGSDSFVARVTDVDGYAEITVNVTVAAVNDAPEILEGDAVTVSMSEDGTPTAFNLTLNAVDIDGGALTWSISAAASHGTTSIASGNMLNYAPNADYNGTDSFVVQVSDGNGGVDTITVNVTIDAVNDTPEITEGASIAVSMSEDGSPTPFSLTLHATDVDGDTLTWSISTPAVHGAAGASGTGASQAITYAPHADYNGTDSFVVQVSDGNGGADTITVNVTIEAVNDAPVMTEGASVSVVMSEDSSPTPYSLTLHATDIEGDTLTWSISIPATYGTADASGTGASQAITYTPHADYNGSDSFVVQVSDGNGGVDTIMVNVTIEAVNDAPVNTTMPSISGTLQVGKLLTANPGNWNDTLDTAVSGSSTLSYAYQWQRADDTSGTNLADISGATTATYTVTAADAHRYLRVTVTATDTGVGTPASQSATASSGFVLIANTAPAITEPSPVSVTMSEDGTPTPFSLTVHATDADGDPLTWSISSPPTNGTVSPVSADAMTYTPNANYNGLDSFAVQVSDSHGGTDAITVNVTIEPVNDAPSFTKGANQTVNEDAGPQTVSGWATAISTGPANETGQTLTFTTTNTNTALFAVQPAISATGTLTYTPAANAYGVATVTVTLKDNGGTLNGGVDTSAAQSFTITVLDMPDPEISLREKVSGTDIPHQSMYNLGAIGANAFMLLEFTINNSGTAALALTGNPLVAISGPQAAKFQVVYEPSATVPAGGSTVFMILFDCPSTDPHSATVTIANTDSDEAPYIFTLVANQPEVNSFILWTK